MDMLAPLITSNVIIGFLLFIIALNYLRSPSRSRPYAPGFPRSVDRDAAYEELWQRNEADLWDWLDSRIGIQTEPFPTNAEDGRGLRMGKKGAKQKVLQDVRMTEREVEEAIRSTEEKLARLKRVVREGKEYEDGSKTSGEQGKSDD